VAVASAGPYANHMQLAPDITMPKPHHSVFTGWIPFLPLNQQRQSTESTSTALKMQIIIHPLFLLTNLFSDTTPGWAVFPKENTGSRAVK